MAGAFDEAVTTGLQRKRTTMEILADLLSAETTQRHAASIRYRMAAARLPAVKDLDAFVFDDTPINEGLVRSLHGGAYLANRRNIVLVGGTGTGKTHLATAIIANVVRIGARGRYFNTVDLVNRLEEETRLGKAGALAAHLCRLDVVVLDELGPAVRPLGWATAVPPDQQALRADLRDRYDQPRLRRMADRVRRSQDDHGPARPHHPPLRHRRDRQRQLALQAAAQQDAQAEGEGQAPRGSSCCDTSQPHMGDGLPARPAVRRAQDPHSGGHRPVQSVLSGPGSTLLIQGHGRRWDAGSGPLGQEPQAHAFAKVHRRVGTSTRIEPGVPAKAGITAWPSAP